jgi:hypothetical protein
MLPDAQAQRRNSAIGIISNQVLQRGSTLRESLLPEVFGVEMEQIKRKDPARQENFPAIAQSNWLKTSVFLVEVCREELSGAGPLVTARQKCSNTILQTDSKSALVRYRTEFDRSQCS